MLRQKLLCRLDGLTTEGGRREFHVKAVTGLSVFVEVAGFFDEHVAFIQFSHFVSRHVRIVVRIVIDHFDVQEHMDFVCLHVDIDVDFLFDVQILASRRNESLLEGVQNHGIIDTLVFNDFLEHVEQVYFRFVLHKLTFLFNFYFDLGRKHFGPRYDDFAGIALEFELQIFFVGI